MTGKTIVYLLLSALHLTFGINYPNPFVSSATKILPLVLLCALIVRYNRHPAVIAALILSMAGDVVSEFNALGEFRLPSQIFFFALAQVCYAFEFLKFRKGSACRAAGRDGRALSVLPFMMGFYALLEIFTLVCASLQDRRHKWCFVLGSSLFLFSDAVILARILSGGFPFASHIVMITYYAAQYFLNVVLLYESQARLQERE